MKMYVAENEYSETYIFTVKRTEQECLQAALKESGHETEKEFFDHGMVIVEYEMEHGLQPIHATIHPKATRKYVRGWKADRERSGDE